MKTITFNNLKPLALTALFIVFAAGLNTASAEDVIGTIQKFKSDHKCYRQTCNNDDDCGGPRYGLCKRGSAGGKLCHCLDGDKYQNN